MLHPALLVLVLGDITSCKTWCRETSPQENCDVFLVPPPQWFFHASVLRQTSSIKFHWLGGVTGDSPGLLPKTFLTSPLHGTLPTPASVFFRFHWIPSSLSCPSCRWLLPDGAIAALLAHAKEWQELLRGKVWVCPGHCKAGGSVGATITSSSCKGEGEAQEVVIRKNSEWEEESKPTQKAG